jgi:triosephosphate isomerase (TIM)
LRSIVIAGNWKMYKTRAQTREYLAAFLPMIQDCSTNRNVVLCSSYTSLETLATGLASQNVGVGAQNLHWEKEGAFTGEISASMLQELKVTHVVIGHSERREYFGETNQTVLKRTQAALAAGLIPIVCVGESKAQRDNNETEAFIFQQLDEGLDGVNLDQVVIAYEPIWAIGTGETCESEEANRVIGLIRKRIKSEQVPILYGGSVKPTNIDEIMAQPEIDGALVGGASLEAESFARIVNYLE